MKKILFLFLISFLSVSNSATENHSVSSPVFTISALIGLTFSSSQEAAIAYCGSSKNPFPWGSAGQWKTDDGGAFLCCSSADGSSGCGGVRNYSYSERSTDVTCTDQESGTQMATPSGTSSMCVTNGNSAGLGCAYSRSTLDGQTALGIRLGDDVYSHYEWRKTSASCMASEGRVREFTLNDGSAGSFTELVLPAMLDAQLQINSIEPVGIESFEAEIQLSNGDSKVYTTSGTACGEFLDVWICTNGNRNSSNVSLPVLAEITSETASSSGGVISETSSNQRIEILDREGDGVAGNNSSGRYTNSSSSSTTSGSGMIIVGGGNSGEGEGEGEDDGGEVTGGLLCDEPPVCSGNAISCSILFQEWKNRCAIAKMNTLADETGEAFFTDLSNADTEFAEDEKDVRDFINVDDALTDDGFTGTCPADVLFLGQSFSVVPLCHFASGIRSIFLIVIGFLSLGIIFKALP